MSKMIILLFLLVLASGCSRQYSGFDFGLTEAPTEKFDGPHIFFRGRMDDFTCGDVTSSVDIKDSNIVIKFGSFLNIPCDLSHQARRSTKQLLDVDNGKYFLEFELNNKNDIYILEITENEIILEPVETSFSLFDISSKYEVRNFGRKQKYVIKRFSPKNLLMAKCGPRQHEYFYTRDDYFPPPHKNFYYSNNQSFSYYQPVTLWIYKPEQIDFCKSFFEELKKIATSYIVSDFNNSSIPIEQFYIYGGSDETLKNLLKTYIGKKIEVVITTWNGRAFKYNSNGDDIMQVQGYGFENASVKYLLSSMEFTKKYVANGNTSLCETPGYNTQNKTSQCFYHLAIAEENELLCNKAVNHREMCFEYLAVEKSNLELCEKIELEKRDNCYWRVNQDLKNEEICDKIQNKYRPNGRDDCYIFIAEQKKTTDPCQKIETEWVKENCISRAAEAALNLNFCDELKSAGSNEKYSKRGMCYAYISLLKKDPSICDKLEGIDKTVCIAKIKDQD